MTPLVSILIPSYNRAPLLAEACASVRAQTWAAWELVVVDDGSTDGTASVVEGFAASVSQRVVYHHQENRGTAAARNAALDRASGSVIAFLDSDDLWRPEYLTACLGALEACAVDWVFAACRMEYLTGGSEISPSTFREEGRARPFMSLATRACGAARVLEDPATLRCHIEHGLWSGLQNSVIRTSVFEGVRFWEGLDVGEDQALVIRALASGRRLAYIDAPLVVYRVHDDNLSGSAKAGSALKHARIHESLVANFEKARAAAALNRTEDAALRRRIAQELFWNVGYNGYRAAGDGARARAAYRRALALEPANLAMWKTAIIEWMRGAASQQP